MANILHTFTNDGLTTFVFESSFGGYGVSMRDDDSGEFVNCSHHGIATIEQAIAEAKNAVGL